eukprot:jgi/Mesvir1/16578/Mv10114-RA.1
MYRARGTRKVPISRTKRPTRLSQPPARAPGLVLSFDSFTGVTPLHGLSGSGKLYAGKRNGEDYIIKEVVKAGRRKRVNTSGIWDTQLAFNEVLASRIYTEIYGVDAINLYVVVNEHDPAFDRFMVASKKIDVNLCPRDDPNQTEEDKHDCNLIVENVKPGQGEVKVIPGAVEPLLVDCILANWDVQIRGNAGIYRGARAGKTRKPGRKRVFRMDVGGSLLYRAMGGPKGANFGPIPGEHNSFFDFSRNKKTILTAMKSYHIPRMFKILESARVETLWALWKRFDEAIDEHVSDAADAEMARAVVDTAIARVVERHQFYIANKQAVAEGLRSRARQLGGA